MTTEPFLNRNPSTVNEKSFVVGNELIAEDITIKSDLLTPFKY
jgi:hypothetical protein